MKYVWIVSQIDENDNTIIPVLAVVSDPNIFINSRLDNVFENQAWINENQNSTFFTYHHAEYHNIYEFEMIRHPVNFV